VDNDPSQIGRTLHELSIINDSSYPIPNTVATLDALLNYDFNIPKLGVLGILNMGGDTIAPLTYLDCIITQQIMFLNCVVVEPFMITEKAQG
jgi:hypothetical protein